MNTRTKVKAIKALEAAADRIEASGVVDLGEASNLKGAQAQLRLLKKELDSAEKLAGKAAASPSDRAEFLKKLKTVNRISKLLMSEFE